MYQAGKRFSGELILPSALEAPNIIEVRYTIMMYSVQNFHLVEAGRIWFENES